MRPAASFNSGAFRFALMIAALFALGSVALLFVVERTIRSYADEATAIGLKSELGTLAHALPDRGMAGLVDTISHRQSTDYEQPFQYLLVDARGKRLAGNLPANAARLGWGQLQFADDPGGTGAAGATEIFQSLGTRLGNGAILVVATDTFDVQKLRQRVDAFTIWSGIGITIVALIGGYVIGNLFLRRLERVNEAVARIMAGSLSERLPRIGMSPEFDHLSQNLNLMLDRIGELMEGLRQVSTDIAHDLRTPLTRLRHQLEGLRDYDSLDAYRNGVAVALDQTDDILAIFRALLRIGSIEGGAGRQLLGPIDLSEVAERVANLYRPLAEDQGKAFIVRIEPGVVVVGDAELIAQVFANLLDNALKYTPIGAIITVSVEEADRLPTAIIADNGPGVPALERDKILRRFYRVDTSRGLPGAGLGLSLVAAIARMHQADVRIGDNNPGLHVRLTFQKDADLSRKRDVEV